MRSPDLDDQPSWLALLGADVETFNAAVAEVPRPGRTMLRESDLAGRDLSLVALAYCDLTGADLTACRVPGAALSRCRLADTNLGGIVFDDDYWAPVIEQIQVLWRGPSAWNDFRREHRPAILESADFSMADLGDADLSAMVLTTSRFDGAVLRHCDLDETSFMGASLVGADLTGLAALLTNFDSADLSDARFDDARLRAVSIRGAILDRTSFRRASLERCDLDGATAADAIFTDATFTDTAHPQP